MHLNYVKKTTTKNNTQYQTNKQTNQQRDTGENTSLAEVIITKTSGTNEPICNVLSPPAVLHRKSHNRPMKMTVEFLSWRYQHASQAYNTWLHFGAWLFLLFTHHIITPLQYSRCLALGKPLQFSQKDIPKIRKRIYKELCDCKLHEQGWRVSSSCTAAENMCCFWLDERSPLVSV